MADLQIAFEFHRCGNGYRVVSPEILPPKYPGGDMIVPNGRAPGSGPPFAKFDTLYSVFAKLKTPDDLLAFINKFGLLMGRGGDAPPHGDSIPEVLTEARFFRDLLSLKQKNPRKIALCFETQLKSRLVAEYKKVGVTLPPNEDDWQRHIGRLVYIEQLMNHGVGRIELVADPARGVQFRITTDCLIGALWFQLAQKLSGDTKIRNCRHCGSWFEAGAGTNRRADSEFCSREHKVRFFSLNRSRGE